MFPIHPGGHADGEPLVAFRDPSGIVARIAVVPRAVALLAVLCDGTRAPAEVAREFERRTGVPVSDGQVERLVRELDDALLLDSPRLHAHREALRAEYARAPRRAPSHAGAAYPGDAGALRLALDGFRAAVAAEPAPPPLAPAPGAPAALVAPHIDYHRGGAMYARAYRSLPAAPPDLVVVLGTDHIGDRRPFTLTRKSFDTPLGAVATDAALVDELARRHAGLFDDELHHRGEHSIELQAVWLRHLYGEAAPPLLPVLCGSLHAAVDRRRPPDDGGFLASLAELTAARRVVVVAAGDLSHVGPRFGDGPLDAEARAAVERADRELLEAVAAGDAAAFFAAVAAAGDRHRVCGLAPIYHALRLVPGRGGALLGYDRCAADDAGASFVTIAAAALP
jgi:MEMO1 family protein